MSESEELDEPEVDMMSTFASVWVKVEVEEGFSDFQIEGREEERREFLPREGSQRNRRHRDARPKKLSCNQCDYRTGYKNSLKLHMLGHSNEKSFACEQCNYKSKYPSALQRHMAIKHHDMSGEPSTENGNTLTLHKCPDCDYTSYYRWNLSSHKRKHKLVKQFKCPFTDCSFETAYRHNYLKHSKTHKEPVVFSCDKCPFTTKFEGHITRHLAKIHNEITETANKCDLCDFTTKHKWRLKLHLSRGKKEETIKCKFCEFETYFMCAYKKHKVDHYNEIYVNPNKNTIDSDPQRNEPDTSLQDKIPDMSTINKYIDKELETLQLCNEYENQNRYNIDPDCVDFNNIQVLETEDKEKPFKCHMCNYASKFKASVQRHFQRHHTGSHNRPYKCVNCDFSTKTKDQIALHNKRSVSDTLVCNICKFTTNYKCQFVMHQKCHYANKCSTCNYSCKNKYELQRHYGAMHLGSGIKCRFCDYRAARKDSVLAHETVHTGTKPFKCQYCGYTSIRKSLLDIHVKKYHSDIKKDVVVVSESKIQSLRVPLVMIGDTGKDVSNGAQVDE